MSKEIVIVGAGIAGLVAANRALDLGAGVTVLESSAHVGGRARTLEQQGFLLNLGPHALYDRGEFRRALVGWGIAIPGKKPPTDGFLSMNTGLTLLPGGPVSFWTSRALTGVQERIELVKKLAAVASPAAWRGKSVRAWAGAGEAAEVALALVRVSSYASVPDEQDAGAALLQLRRALMGSVWYVDGGWGGLVGALWERVRARGARMVSQRVFQLSELPPNDGVVLALPPAQVAALTGQAFSVVPVHAACLDVCLSRLPVPENRFVLGLEKPDYFAVHSMTARLGPPQGAVIHVARYLGAAAPPAREELEGLLDTYQPGWRECITYSRYLPHLQVCGAVDHLHHPRPLARLDDRVWMAGDWLASAGMLADASADTGMRAAEELLDAHS